MQHFELRTGGKAPLNFCGDVQSEPITVTAKEKEWINSSCNKVKRNSKKNAGSEGEGNKNVPFFNKRNCPRQSLIANKEYCS